MPNSINPLMHHTGEKSLALGDDFSFVFLNMQNYRKTSHTTYDCKYHIVWITKYREKELGGEVGKRVRELIREICNSK